MKSLEKILAEIADLQHQEEDTRDAIRRIQEKNRIWCSNCQLYDIFCQRNEQFPNCFQPNEEWRKEHEEVQNESD